MGPRCTQTSSLASTDPEFICLSCLFSYFYFICRGCSQILVHRGGEKLYSTRCKFSNYGDRDRSLTTQEIFVSQNRRFVISQDTNIERKLADDNLELEAQFKTNLVSMHLDYLVIQLFRFQFIKRLLVI